VTPQSDVREVHRQAAAAVGAVGAASGGCAAAGSGSGSPGFAGDSKGPGGLRSGAASAEQSACEQCSSSPREVRGVSDAGSVGPERPRSASLAMILVMLNYICPSFLHSLTLMLQCQLSQVDGMCAWTRSVQLAPRRLRG
jgi:hypothetical protein